MSSMTYDARAGQSRVSCYTIPISDLAGLFLTVNRECLACCVWRFCHCCSVDSPNLIPLFGRVLLRGDQLLLDPVSCVSACHFSLRVFCRVNLQYDFRKANFANHSFAKRSFEKHAFSLVIHSFAKRSF